jgi:hypothetical protein
VVSGGFSAACAHPLPCWGVGDGSPPRNPKLAPLAAPARWPVTGLPTGARPDNGLRLGALRASKAQALWIRRLRRTPRASGAMARPLPGYRLTNGSPPRKVFASGRFAPGRLRRFRSGAFGAPPAPWSAPYRLTNGSPSRADLAMRGASRLRARAALYWDSALWISNILTPGIALELSDVTFVRVVEMRFPH